MTVWFGGMLLCKRVTDFKELQVFLFNCAILTGFFQKIEADDGLELAELPWVRRGDFRWHQIHHCYRLLQIYCFFMAVFTHLLRLLVFIVS